MYFDLFLPFPLPEDSLGGGSSKKNSNKNKGKGKQQPSDLIVRKSCWEGIDVGDKERFTRNFALAGHLGYSVIGCTVHRPSESQAYPTLFPKVPFPELDPRSSSDTAGESSSNGAKIVQVTRFHFQLDSATSQPLTSGNTSVLREYDILSCQPTTEKALQLACTDLSNPGPNQLSIITLPLYERPFTFRFNRKQIRQAQRNGVAFEIIYSAALFPPSSTSPETNRRTRQNWLSNARELVRVTGGKGIMFSSGPGGGTEGLRGPQDVINLGTVLGMPANLAKDAVSLNPKMVLLKAQARRTYKAVLSEPRILPPLNAVNGVATETVIPEKRSAEEETVLQESQKKRKVSA